jgi:hypothetical protein
MVCRALPLVACVLLVLAGCSGFAGDGGENAGVDGGGDDDSDRSATVTPAPVPAIEPTPMPPTQVLPGVSRTRVVNASVLAAAHDGLLENTSYTVVRNVTYRAANGTVLTRRRSVSAVDTGDRIHVRRTWEGVAGLAREAVWSNGTRLFRARTDTNGTTTYWRTSLETIAGQRPVTAGTGSGQIERIFAVTDARVVDRYERNGTRIYHLRSPNATLSGTTPTASTGREPSVSVEAVVTARGVVQAYEFRQTFSGEASGAANVVVATRYTDIGTTTVSRPPWYDEALNATSATNRTEAGSTNASASTNTSASTTTSAA